MSDFDKAKLEKIFHDAVVKLLTSKEDFLFKVLHKAIDNQNTLKFVKFLYEYIKDRDTINENQLKQIEVIINEIKMNHNHRKEAIFEETDGVSQLNLFESVNEDEAEHSQ